MALINAGNMAYNNIFELNTYLTIFYKALDENKSLSGINTLIRIDRNHSVKAMTNFKCLTKSITIIKQLYVRSLALLIDEQNFNLIKKVFKNLVILALSKTGRMFTNELGHREPSPCQIAYDELFEFIGTRSIGEVIPQNDDELDRSLNVDTNIVICDDYVVSEDAILSENNTVNSKEFWIDSIIKEVKSSVLEQGEDTNYEMLHSILPYLKRYGKLVPLWTRLALNVRPTAKEKATTASIESCYHILKSNVFKLIDLPIRIDEFIDGHVEYLQGKLIDHSTKLTEFDKNDKVMDKITSKNFIPSSQDLHMFTNVEADDYFEIPESGGRKCPVCKNERQNKTKMETNHFCSSCKKPVHNIDACSKGYGDEGHNQVRMCYKCVDETTKKSKTWNKNKRPTKPKGVLEDDPAAEEYWNGKRQSVRKIAKPHSYLNPKPSFGFFNNTKTIPYFLSTMEIVIHNISYIFNNICAYNSIISALFHGYKDTKFSNAYLVQHKNAHWLNQVELLSKNRLNDFYIKKAEFLLKYYQKKSRI